MNREKSSQTPTRQIDFIDSICIPLYSALAKLFPSQLTALLAGCRENRETWRKLALETPALESKPEQAQQPSTEPTREPTAEAIKDDTTQLTMEKIENETASIME